MLSYPDLIDSGNTQQQQQRQSSTSRYYTVHDTMRKSANDDSPREPVLQSSALSENQKLTPPRTPRVYKSVKRITTGRRPTLRAAAKYKLRKFGELSFVRTWPHQQTQCIQCVWDTRTAGRRPLVGLHGHEKYIFVRLHGVCESRPPLKTGSVACRTHVRYATGRHSSALLLPAMPHVACLSGANRTDQWPRHCCRHRDTQ